MTANPPRPRSVVQVRPALPRSVVHALRPLRRLDDATLDDTAETRREERERMNDCTTHRSLWDRLTRPSMPLLLAYYFVAWVALLVVVALLMADPGCTGEGVVLR